MKTFTGMVLFGQIVSLAVLAMAMSSWAFVPRVRISDDAWPGGHCVR